MSGSVYVHTHNSKGKIVDIELVKMDYWTLQVLWVLPNQSIATSIDLCHLHKAIPLASKHS